MPAQVPLFRSATRLLLPLLLSAILAGCASLPSLEGRMPSSVITDTAQTKLATAIAPMVAQHPGTSGI